ncbi:MAG: hypothetical protein PHY29_05410 [Syntrophales bacterium]|nr:hypothetical protein [Syntrophales bacterium]
MVRGISFSREALIGDLDQMAQRIQETYGVKVRFAEIMGRRWSYIAGRKEDGISLFPSRRIELTDRFGLVSDGWENILADEREAIVSSLRETIRVYE